MNLWKIQIFAETADNQSLQVLSNFDHNLRPEDGWIGEGKMAE